jgi:hypothetical protein
MVKSEPENVVKAESRGLVMVVRVLAAMRNLLGDLGLKVAVCKWRKITREKFIVRPFRVEIKCLALVGCA